MKNTMLKYTLTSLFALLYLAVGFVSVYHAIYFFGLSNENWLAIILACAFEVGQAAILFYLLVTKDKKAILPWILMIVLTLVQVLGNVYSSYMYMMINNTDLIKYFTDSVLFYLQDPDPKVNQVMISYITGAILPIVSLCMTSMVVNTSGIGAEEETVPDIKQSINPELIDIDNKSKSEAPVIEGQVDETHEPVVESEKKPETNIEPEKEEVRF